MYTSCFLLVDMLSLFLVENEHFHTLTMLYCIITLQAHCQCYIYMANIEKGLIYDKWVSLSAEWVTIPSRYIVTYDKPLRILSMKHRKEPSAPEMHLTKLNESNVRPREKCCLSCPLDVLEFANIYFVSLK